MATRIAAAILCITVILTIACGEKQPDPFAVDADQPDQPAISETTAETETLEPPTPTPALPGGGPQPPASRTPEIERVSLSTPDIIPTPTSKPRPTFFPTRGPDINEIQSWDLEKIALAYAHCNGTYTGEEREYRYRTASDAMFLNAYEQHKISSLIAEHCSGNFNTRPDITPTPAPTQSPDSPLLIDYSERYEYLLNLLNVERKKRQVAPLELSLVTAAQKHADQNRLSCSNGYWSTDGKNLALRYTEHGGRQPFTVVMFGEWYCEKNPDHNRTITWQEAMDQVVQNMVQHGPPDFLNPEYRTASIGHSSSSGQHWNVIILEKQLILMPNRPNLSSSKIISIKGSLLEPAKSEENQEMFVRILHAPLVKSLTRWQTGLAPSDEPGILAGEIIVIPQHLSTPTPYDNTVTRLAGYTLPHDLNRQATGEQGVQTTITDGQTEGPTNANEARELAKTRNTYRQHFTGWNVTVPVIRAKSASIAVNGDFVISARITPILDRHKDGIYTVLVYGTIDGQVTELSRTAFTVHKGNPALDAE